MNERIKELAEQAGYEKDMFGVGHWDMPECKKFAELILIEVTDILSTYRGKVVFEDGAEYNYEHPIIAIRKHFGVEESRTQPDQEAAAFIAAENKKVASRYGYVPKLHPSEWKD